VAAALANVWYAPYADRASQYLETYCLSALAFISFASARAGIYFDKGWPLDAIGNGAFMAV